MKDLTNLKSVTLSGKEYPLRITGNGPIPCIVTGWGSLTENTISPRFKEMFTVYLTNLYWDKRDALSNPTSLTMEKVCCDIQSIADQLKLDKYVIFGHSCYGLVALETVKSDQRIKGVIMAGTPTAWNPAHNQKAQQYFKETADEGRKENDRQRRAHFQKIKKPDEHLLTIDGYISETSYYWADYNLDDDIIRKTWEGINPDEQIVGHFFDNVLPNFSIENNIEKVQCPVFLAGGLYDFDCIPLLLWKSEKVARDLSDKLTLLECLKSGHWPHFEEPEFFDEGLAQWLKKIKI
ncbi:MAG: alpha/beta hydrolase [Alphaproteobacteria bacterium]|nr:alpha/beta hydrolase [Alphaproteobacteria bacterium]